MDKYFVRDFKLSNDVSLEFLQHTVGECGCVVWDAALVLAGYLDNSVKRLQNLNILELGSGTGCVGLVAAALGANVVLTDLQEMIPLIIKNVAKNSSVLKGKIDIQVFDWGSDVKSLPNCEEGFDIVLVADCIYYKESLDALIQTLGDLCHQSKKTEIILAYEDRESEEKQNLVQEFIRKMKEICTLTKVSFDDYREDFRCEDIHLYKIAAIDK